MRSSSVSRAKHQAEPASSPNLPSESSLAASCQSSWAQNLGKFCRDISGPPSRESKSQIGSTTALHRMAYEPGMPKPGNYLAFEVAKEAFLKAAAANDVASLKAAGYALVSASLSVSLAGGSASRSSDVYYQALAVAAKHDAFGATQYILKSNDLSLSSREWQNAIEIAFVTACRHGAYDVVGFYLSKELGDEYKNAVTLRPNVLAWGIYRSSEARPSDDLLQKVRESNAQVAEIYERQMALLTHAEKGEDSQLTASIALIGNESSFVLREAAEKAIRRGHAGTTQLLLPHVPVYWLPELVKISCECGRLDIADSVINQVGTIGKSYRGGFADFESILLGRSAGPSFHDLYGIDKLHAQGIIGAASKGHLELVKQLVERSHGSDHLETAALTAVEHRQLEILSWAISKTGIDNFRVGEDKKFLSKLMTAAIARGSKEARDLLIREKGGALCVTRDHLEALVKANDQEAYDALVNQGVPRLELSHALRGPRSAASLYRSLTTHGLHMLSCLPFNAFSQGR